MTEICNPKYLKQNHPITLSLAPVERAFFSSSNLLSRFNEYADAVGAPKMKLTKEGLKVAQAKQLADLINLFTPTEYKQYLFVRGIIKKTRAQVLALYPPQNSFEENRFKKIFDEENLLTLGGRDWIRYLPDHPDAEQLWQEFDRHAKEQDAAMNGDQLFAQFEDEYSKPAQVIAFRIRDL